jgi:hypothetical protein
VDPGFVGPEAYTIFRALFKKNNTKLQIKIKHKRKHLFRAPVHEAEASLASS